MTYFLDKMFPTLIGTLLGACLAFAVKWVQDWRAERQSRVASANYALFVLIQQLNDLVQTEATMAPWLPETQKGTRWLDMKSMIGFTESLPLRTEDLGWLLQTKHRNLVGQYMAARNGYLTVQGLVSHRNEMKELLNDHLEAEIAKAGLGGSEEFLPAEFLAANISTRQRIRLTDLTEGLIQHNGSALSEHYRILEDLYNAFKDVYPNEHFIKLDLEHDPLKMLGLSLRAPGKGEEIPPEPKVHRIEVN